MVESWQVSDESAVKRNRALVRSTLETIKTTPITMESENMADTASDGENEVHVDHSDVIANNCENNPMDERHDNLLSEGISGHQKEGEIEFVKHLLTANGSTQVLFVLLLMAMSQGSTVGVVPAILSDRYARQYYGYSLDEPCYSFGAHDNLPQECKDGANTAQGAAAISSLIRSLCSFATSSLMGSITDMHGRRGLLIVSLALASLAPISMLAIVIVTSLNPWFYYAADATRGIVYGLPLFLSALSDVTPSKWKTGSFGAVTAVYALGYALSPLFAVAFSNYQSVCVTSLMFMLLAVLFALCYLPETLQTAELVPVSSPERSSSTTNHEGIDNTLPENTGSTAYHEGLDNNLGQNESDDECFVPDSSPSSFLIHCEYIGRMLHRPIRELGIVKRSRLFVLLSLLSLFAGMNLSADSTFTIYYIENEMHFNDGNVSVFFILLGGTSLLTQGVVLAPLTACVGEKVVMVVGFVLSALHSFLYGFARNKATIFVASATAGVAGMALPTIGSVMANNVSSQEQGRIQGALYSLSSLAQGLGPVFLQSIYNRVKDTKYPGPGGMFIAAGILQLASIVISCVLSKDKTDFANRNTTTRSHICSNIEEITIDGNLRSQNSMHCPLLSDNTSTMQEERLSQ